MSCGASDFLQVDSSDEHGGAPSDAGSTAGPNASSDEMGLPHSYTSWPPLQHQIAFEGEPKPFVSKKWLDSIGVVPSCMYGAVVIIILVVLYWWILFGGAHPGLLSLPPQISWRLLITPTVSCADDPPFVALFSMVNAADFEGREVLRSTWGAASVVLGRRVRRFFVLGTHPFKAMQEVVEAEAAKHGDILQHTAPDKYSLLTLKAITVLQWVATSCPQTKFLVKADSDIFLDVEKVVSYLMFRENEANVAAGTLLSASPVLRSPSHRNYQDPAVYPQSSYPPYMSGPCYMLSVDLVSKMAEVSKKIPRVRNEDCFIGLCLNALGIRPQASAPMAPMEMDFDDSSDVSELTRWAVAHPVRRERLLALWSAVRQLRSTP
ncbi:hypothetical protein Esti_004965 [Eimeria stiedai]